MAELSEHAIFFDVFHDVNSNLYTVFTVTSFHIFQKRTRNSKTWKPDGKRQEIKGSKKVNIHV